MGGAKNHGIIMPDANMDQAVKDILGAAYGSAGERCMALPVVVPVGEGTAERFLEKMLPAIEAMKVGVSEDPDADYGPVVTGVHRDSIKAQVSKAVEEGAELLVDGREFELQGYEDGFFIGPSLLDNVTPDMETYQDEIFGPVLQIVRAENFEDALKLPSEHQYGNGVAIFTQNQKIDAPLYQTLDWKGFEERDLLMIELTSEESYIVSQGLISGSETTIKQSLFDDTKLRDRVICKSATDFVLIGKDTGIKKRWNELPSLVDIYNTIDAMPMRRFEMRQTKK